MWERTRLCQVPHHRIQLLSHATPFLGGGSSEFKCFDLVGALHVLGHIAFLLLAVFVFELF